MVLLVKGRNKKWVTCLDGREGNVWFLFRISAAERQSRSGDGHVVGEVIVDE